MGFSEDVWDLCRRVPRGKVTTYAEIARAMGTNAYRAVGNALNRNPYAPVVPCHRVVNSDGRVGGFARGRSGKVALLLEEGVSVERGKVDLERHFMRLR